MITCIDGHAHHQQMPFEEAVSVIRAAVEAGISSISLGGTDPSDWKAQVQLLQRFPKVLLLNFGLHPWWVEKFSRAEIDTILDQLDRELPLVSALGETGLDFYATKRDASRFDDQRYAFRAQLRLAVKHQKPAVLHIVSAHEEAVKIVEEEGASNVPLIIHRFSGTVDEAKAWISLGAYLSFHEPKKIMKTVPIDRLLLETDSHAGVHPGGWDIRPHYEKSAEIMGLALDDFAQKLAENFAEIGYSQPQ